MSESRNDRLARIGKTLSEHESFSWAEGVLACESSVDGHADRMLGDGYDGPRLRELDDPRPDIDDDATCGVLLGMVEHKHGPASIVALMGTGSTTYAVFIEASRWSTKPHDTKGEALAAALMGAVR